MTWKLQFIVCCVTIVISSANKNPINLQSPGLSEFSIEEEQKHTKEKSDYVRPNVRSVGVSRSIDVSNRQDLQGVSEQVITYKPQIEVATRRSENVSAKTLGSFVKPTRRRVQAGSNKIVFPGSPVIASRRTIEIPDNCKNLTYCEDIPNYPHDEIDALINKLGDKNIIFPFDKLDRPDTPDINQRVGPVEENIELCNFQEKMVYPQAAEGSDGKWHTLINRKGNPLQAFRVEICEDDGTSCSNMIYLQKGYTARCKQKYVLRTAIAVEKVGDTFKEVQREVKLPGCCSCVLKVVLL